MKTNITKMIFINDCFVVIYTYNSKKNLNEYYFFNDSFLLLYIFSIKILTCLIDQFSGNSFCILNKIWFLESLD